MGKPSESNIVAKSQSPKEKIANAFAAQGVRKSCPLYPRKCPLYSADAKRCLLFGRVCCSDAGPVLSDSSVDKADVKTVVILSSAIMMH
jgi:hypothetical protein